MPLFFRLLSCDPDELMSILSTMTLIDAIEDGDEGAARRLLESGADPNQVGECGEAALAVAAVEGKLSIVELLLAHGADPATIGPGGTTALHSAQGHKVYERLLGSGTPVNVQDDEGWTALYLGVKDPKIVKVLLDHGADPNLMTKNHETPLSFCAAWGLLESARLLLDSGVDPNGLDNGLNEKLEWSVLFDAAGAGEVEVTELLLERGADPDYRTSTVQTALGLALQYEHLDTALLLAERSSEATRRAVVAQTATLHEKVRRLMRSINRS